jgi:hypothetical protein
LRSGRQRGRIHARHGHRGPRKYCSPAPEPTRPRCALIRSIPFHSIRRALRVQPNESKLRPVRVSGFCSAGAGGQTQRSGPSRRESGHRGPRVGVTRSASLLHLDRQDRILLYCEGPSARAMTLVRNGPLRRRQDEIQAGWQPVGFQFYHAAISVRIRPRLAGDRLHRQHSNPGISKQIQLRHPRPVRGPEKCRRLQSIIVFCMFVREVYPGVVRQVPVGPLHSNLQCPPRLSRYDDMQIPELSGTSDLGTPGVPLKVATPV